MSLSVFLLSVYCLFFFLMIRRPPRSTRTDTLFPHSTLFRSGSACRREVVAAAGSRQHAHQKPGAGAATHLEVVAAVAHHGDGGGREAARLDRKSTRLNSSH